MSWNTLDLGVLLVRFLRAPQDATVKGAE